MSRVTQELRALSSRWGNQSAIAAIAQLAVLAFAAGAVLMGVTAYWCAAASLIAGLILANRRWPRVRIRGYLRTKKAALPAALIAGGVGCQYVIAGVLPGLSAVGGSTTGMLIGGLGGACALSLVMMIFEGKAMKDIFDLIPAAQQPALQQFLAGDTAPRVGVGGQAADFRGLDPTAVADAIKRRVIGQDRIVDDVLAMAFRRAELKRPHKPLAVALFVGATGAGKSELGKALAQELFDGRLIDMPLNQMKKSEDVWGLIGPPPGYQGAERGGRLCRELGRNGTGVLMLDEAEKAHPDVLQVLMRLLDTGEITEQSTGDVYSARGFLIVLTSNAAAQEIAAIGAAEPDRDAREIKSRHALQQVGWLPEILGRLDGIYPFPPLDRTAIARVVGLMAQRHAEAAGVEIVALDAELLVDLIQQQEAGADAGMRNLDRLVERAVLDGVLAVRNAGYKQAAIRVIDGRVDVQPVA